MQKLKLNHHLLNRIDRQNSKSDCHFQFSNNNQESGKGGKGGEIDKTSKRWGRGKAERFDK